MSVKSDHTEGHLLVEKLQAIKLKQVSMQGVSGFFVTKKSMSALEDQLHDLMESGKTSVSPAVLLDLQDQITEMTRRANDAERRLHATESARIVLAENLTEAKAALAVAHDDFDKVKSRLLEEKKELTDKVKIADDAIRKARKQATDPDEIEAVVNEKKSLQARLEEKNSLIKQGQAEINVLHKRVASLTVEKSSAELTKAELIRQAWAKRDLEPIEPELMSSSLLKRAFSPASLKIINEAAAARQDQVREFAYKTMELAVSTDPRNFVGYKDYANALWQTVKTSSNKKRERYFPLIDSLYKSMALKAGPTFNQVKEQYKDLFDPSEEKVETTKRKEKERTFTYWDAFKIDFWLFKKTISIKCREIKASLEKRLQGVTFLWTCLDFKFK